MFQVGDKVVHPMHGAGVIDSIVQRKVAGQLQEYYQLKLSVGNMVVMVPTDNIGEIGMRPRGEGPAPAGESEGSVQRRAENAPHGQADSHF